MIYKNVLEAIGYTPIIELQKMVGEDSARVLVKYEGLNVGGSIKTRTALNMILAAEEAGILKPDSIIVEPTSGNQGIGLALVGAVKGYETVIIMPDSVSEERRLLVEHYGAKVVLIHDAGNIGDCIDECVKTALRMKEENPRVYVPQQFENQANPMVHRHHTGLEILEQVAGPIDGFCSGIGTGGTITGIGETLKALNPQITIWAVEPENAAILAGGTVGNHIQMGIGDGVIPTVLNQCIYEDIAIISDEEALHTAMPRQRAAPLRVCPAWLIAIYLQASKSLLYLSYFSNRFFNPRFCISDFRLYIPIREEIVKNIIRKGCKRVDLNLNIHHFI